MIVTNRQKNYFAVYFFKSKHNYFSAFISKIVFVHSAVLYFTTAVVRGKGVNFIL